MARKMPAQKPGRSETVVVTPPEFIAAVKKRLGIKRFAIDLAASAKNTQADDYYSIDDDALHVDTHWYWGYGEWGWLNPPYDRIEPWVQKADAYDERQIAMLVPASVGSNWWARYVHDKCSVLFLNGRITFVGHESPYPKDLALLLYGVGDEGYDIWRWKDE